ncbi:hypothetical protein BHE74_00040019 [Ensete ventricosum]|nr:hypothetical protein BHE74_00040019 [Ensete ventricosum]
MLDLGFWIGGFGLGENVEERPALLNAVTDNLPEEKARFISGLSLPEEVLQGVASGIDLFDSTYIYHLTLGGFALIFPFEILDHNNLDFQLDDTVGDRTKINLRATIYRCVISVLLIHNTHHYLGFFRAMREAIKGGKFDLFRRTFVESRRIHLTSAVLCS